MNPLEKILTAYTIEEPRDRPEEPEYPFEAQIEYQGLALDIENLKGSTRSGVDENGNKWESTMYAHYGELRGQNAPDGDYLDVFVGPEDDAQWVFVVHQVHPGGHEKAGQFDEDKVMLGFSSADDAISCYLKHYDRPDYFGGVTMVSMPEFKAWVSHPDSDSKPVQPPAQWKTDYLRPRKKDMNIEAMSNPLTRTKEIIRTLEEKLRAAQKKLKKARANHKKATTITQKVRYNTAVKWHQKTVKSLKQEIREEKQVLRDDTKLLKKEKKASLETVIAKFS